MTRIKEIREEQLLGQPFIARLLNISLEEYQQIEENGYHQASETMQNTLCKLYGVEPIDFTHEGPHQSLEDRFIKQLESQRQFINQGSSKKLGGEHHA